MYALSHWHDLMNKKQSVGIVDRVEKIIEMHSYRQKNQLKIRPWWFPYGEELLIAGSSPHMSPPGHGHRDLIFCINPD